jgi:hypothetical protein
MATAKGKTQQWHASYWDENKHGSAWERVKEAIKRDWVQTKADFNAHPGAPNPLYVTNELDDRPQGATASAETTTGQNVIRPGGVQDPKGFTKTRDVKEGERLEHEFEDNLVAIEYGFVAHEYYGPRFGDWNEEVERKLESEWNPQETGMKFDQAKRYVKKGWDFRK